MRFNFLLLAAMVWPVALVGCGASSEKPNDASTGRDGARQPDARAQDGLSPIDGAGKEVGLDSASDGADVEPPVPPQVIQPGGTCAAPELLTLKDGRVSVMGAFADLGGPIDPKIRCVNESVTNGNIGYYRVALAAHRHYRLTLRTDAYVALSVFDESVGCDGQAAAKACSASPRPSGHGFGRAVVELAPEAVGTYLVAIERRGTGGTPPNLFHFVIEELGAPPPNDLCDQAASISLSGGKATVVGNPSVAKVPFSAPLTCWGEPHGEGDRALFYRLSLQGGLGYSFHLRPTRCDHQLYVVDAPCDRRAIEALCTDNHVTSYLDYAAQKSGEYLVAVSGSCPFTLDIREGAPPSNGRCADAERLTFLAGKATVKGSTVGATNEHKVDCGSVTSNGPQNHPAYAEGPQVYYRINLEADIHYRIATRSSFRATPYVFSAEANCEPAKIESDCNSGTSGARLSKITVPQSREITFKPEKSGDYIVAVDSSYRNVILPSHGPPAPGLPLGEFELVVERLKQDAHARCETPQTITLQSGNARIQGNTGGAAGQLEPRCGPIPQFASSWPPPPLPALVGPERYFRFDGKANTAYHLRLEPSFAGYVYALDRKKSNCDPAAHSAACNCRFFSSSPIACSAAMAASWSPDVATTTYHVGDQDQEVLVVVDSAHQDARGSFLLEIEAQKHEGDRCAAPIKLSLTQNPTTIRGTTAFARDEFSSWLPDFEGPTLLGVGCGNRKVWAGGQVYYRMSLERAKHYTVWLDPEFDGALYAFPAATPCTKEDISLACTTPTPLKPGRVLNSDMSGRKRLVHREVVANGGCGCGAGTYHGVGGESVEVVGSDEWLHIAPDRTEDWIVVVDSIRADEVGPFTLSLSWR